MIVLRKIHGIIVKYYLYKPEYKYLYKFKFKSIKIISTRYKS